MGGLGEQDGKTSVRDGSGTVDPAFGQVPVKSGIFKCSGTWAEPASLARY